MVRRGAAWRMMPHGGPPWEAVYQRTQRWLGAGVFDDPLHDLRALLRLPQGRKVQPSATILDSRTLQSSPESGKPAGYDGAKRKRGRKVHKAVDTLGHLLAWLSRLPTSKTVIKCTSWRSAFNRSLANRFGWPSSIRATRAISPSRKLTMASSLRSPSCPKQGRASSCTWALAHREQLRLGCRLPPSAA